jgi:hypothetical protein
MKASEKRSAIQAGGPDKQGSPANPPTAFFPANPNPLMLGWYRAGRWDPLRLWETKTPLRKYGPPHPGAIATRLALPSAIPTGERAFIPVLFRDFRVFIPAWFPVFRKSGTTGHFAGAVVPVFPREIRGVPGILRWRAGVLHRRHG